MIHERRYHRGLEELIIRAMTGRTDVLVPAYKPTGTVPRCPAEQAGSRRPGPPQPSTVDLVQLAGFIQLTQEDLYDARTCS